jgi:peptide/nickel transport system permease protein
MFQFILRRIGFILLVCIFILFSVHLGMRMIRNSEAQDPNFDLLTQSQLAWGDTREYISRAQDGDLGTIRETHGWVPVADILRTAYLNSMGLMVVALVGGALAGLTIGSFAALTRHKRALIPLLSLTILGISTPSFFAGILLRQGELLYLRVFGRPLVSMAGFGWDYQHMLMPVLVLAARPLAYLTRTSYLALRRVMTEDYIRTAFAKGLSQRRAVNVHALRNFAIPVLTAVGVSLRFSLSTLPIVEFLFVWPGMGLRLLQAIDARQTLVVATLAVAMGLTFLSLNFLLDLTYRIIDPRLRSAENE